MSEKIGTEWPVHLDQLQGLKQWADDPNFQREVMKVKQDNKTKLAAYLREATGIDINPNSIFDIQVSLSVEIPIYVYIDENMLNYEHCSKVPLKGGWHYLQKLLYL